MASKSMQPIGKAFIVYGTVKAVSAAGVERILTPNSPIYANERIVTGPDGSISIVFAGNQGHLDLGRMSDVMVDEDVYGGGQPGDSADAVAQVEDIQSALQDADFDPTTDLPAPAAGAGVAGGTGPRGGGRQIVVFDADMREVTPDSGAETRGIGLNFLDQDFEVFSEVSSQDVTETPSIDDTTDPTTLTTTVSLTATSSVTEAGSSITYTATLTNPADAGSPVTVTLSNGAVITIAGGASSGFVVHPVPADEDVYLDPDTASAYIETATGGNFENLLIDSTPAGTTITDTVDLVTATLSTSTTQINGTGGEITYTVTLTGSPAPIDPDNPLVFTLTDGITQVTVAAGATSGSITRIYTDNEITNQQAIVNSIASFTGGTEYEHLITAGSTAVDVQYPPVVAPAAAVVSEEGLSGSNPDTSGSTDTTNSTSFTGVLSATDADGDTLTYTFGTPPLGLTSNNASIVWSGAGTGSLIGTAGGAEIIKAVIGADGTYTVTLAGPVNHPAGKGENTINILLPVNVSDGIATTSTTLTVVVEDDSPILGAFDPGTLPNQVGTVTGEFVLAPGADGIDHFNIIGPAITGVHYTTSWLSDGTTTLHGLTPGGADIFTLTVRPDGTYTYSLVTPDAGMTDTYNLTNLPAGGPNWRETTDGRIEFSSPGGINSTNNGFGVGNTFVEAGESFTMEFHNPGNPGDNIANTNAQLIDSVTLTVNSLNGPGGTYTWVADNTMDAAGPQTGTITINNTGTYIINPTISFNTLTITGGSDVKNQGAQFSVVSVTHNIVPQDMMLEFQVAAIDNDGDLSAAQILSIHQVAGDNTGAFTLTGFTGTVDDWIAGSTAVDQITGGEGFDIVDYTDSTAAVSINLDDSGHASGTPVTFNNPADGKIGGGDAAGDSLSGIEGIVGGHGNDVLSGNTGDNYLNGGLGADTLKGEGGNDILVGGKGADAIDGGAGNDHITYDGSDSSIAGGVDVDTLVVQGAAAINLSATDQSSGDTANVTGFEHVDASGSVAAVHLTGDGNSNVLTGGSGNDTLDGGLGDDILTGGKGGDIFTASAGNDHITDYDKFDNDVIDIGGLVAGASKDNLAVTDDGGGKAQLHIYNSTTDHSTATEVGSITFDNIDSVDATSLDSLLGQVDIKDV